MKDYTFEDSLSHKNQLTMSKPIINRNEQEWNKNAKSKLLYKFYHDYSDENKTLHPFLSYLSIQFLLLFTPFKMQNSLDS